MTRYFNTAVFLAASVSGLALGPALAQDSRWVQLEAHRELDVALTRAQQYQDSIGNVSGFQLPSEWYALTLGPFETDTDAFEVRRQLRAERAIPPDAFVSSGENYRARIFPVDGAAVAPQVTPQTPPVETPDPLATAEPEPEPEPEETLREAQISERQLDRDQRADLQTALQWFGFYTQRIDAAFGPGTRRSMAAWQADNGYEETGVLTTRQRAELLDDYQSELAALGMQTIRDADAGIEIALPLAMVDFDRHEAPFSRFTAKDDSGVQVLLLSQPGNQATLFGLYEIMQTLEIVPLEGAREREANSFTLTGQNEELRSHTFAQFRGGQIKGYTLVWTPERDDQMARVLPMMQESFTTFGGTLPESTGQASQVARSALLAGLAVRRPDFSRSGFYIDATGTTLTTAQAVAQCDRVTLDEAYTARVRARDDALNIAVLEPETPLVPLAFAQFAEGDMPVGQEITISGYSFEDMLTRPVLTFGRLDATGGLNGEDGVLRLNVTVAQGDLGGPVFGPNGAVLGLLSGQPPMENRQLPPEVNFAVSAQAIRGFLSENGVASGTLRDGVSVPPEQLTRVAGDLTVLVSCWN
ncbi:MAG: peptidoglycan-binding protein [Roseibaca calidilacus]|uniref:Peptidoglycan binding domain-containing protein n=1 Tax=Roseibaca calidilacus TaxID=1666912 RepID=A0A0P7YMP3_9RHOB|nr:serine protease [Roseibaca calidilacus]KPP89842.1 MAG: peptidoglycan-binding protein [Roseibaca calidilacus]CUX80853.1 Putative peptidoglycan binding domain-containing protein [Roseibaca calidilacus]